MLLKFNRQCSLYDYFVKNFGRDNSDNYKKAANAFSDSLAGYSLVCYILQIKDRHNANILIDKRGHMIHIDFGFMLTDHTGKVDFEKAPFKLTEEFMRILGGQDSKTFKRYRKSMIKGF
mmetsp:Transcript_3216/g.2181  ORF Transcript_3216/g.2181 Transcript_3216/m.2181 type:complete len:119 (-) Transcript_3216:366-722(-)